METSQEEFEHQLMELLLQGNHPILAILRQQYAVAKVIEREFSGAGFFTTFEVPDSVPLSDPLNFSAGHVGVDLEMLPGGVGSVLFVKNGKLHFLECYTYLANSWPDKYIIKSFSAVMPAIPDY